MRPRRGTAIKPDASAELLLPRSTPRHRQGAPAPDAGRFSPLNAPQRALVESFLGEARTWAMRQARRSYRHLPAELHEQAFDQAAMALRTGAPADFDRRTLYAVLADHLDEQLRRIHVGWCLNQARVESPGTAPSAPIDTVPSGQPITAFIEEGLGGLERAVLQLELGAGRDTHTVRAALRLGPRQYGRHRELGLAKLRGAISGGLNGRVCEQHLEAVTLAATGDRQAADELASGPARCRACAREAAGLRRVLQQRLALAPWPFVIKPAGALAAKLGALGTIFGGKSALGGAGFAASSAGGAKVVAALVATAAVATGGIAAVESDSASRSAAAAAASEAVTVASPATRVTGSATTASAATERATAATRRRAAARRRAAERKAADAKSQTAAPAATAETPSSAPTDSGAPASSSSKPLEPVRTTVDRVRKTVDDAKGKLPVQTPPVVDQVTNGLDRTVDDVTGLVDGLLAP